MPINSAQHRLMLRNSHIQLKRLDGINYSVGGIFTLTDIYLLK